MTYLSAAGLAQTASAAAKNSRAQSEDRATAQLADAVDKLSQAVAELARSLHRNSD